MLENLRPTRDYRDKALYIENQIEDKILYFQPKPEEGKSENVLDIAGLRKGVKQNYEKMKKIKEKQRDEKIRLY